MKIYLFSSAKVLLLFEIRKFLHKKNAKFLIFYAKSRISCLLCTKKSLSEERLSFAMRLGLVAVLLVVLLTALPWSLAVISYHAVHRTHRRKSSSTKPSWS